jgi:hypothetical protein
MNEPIQNRPLMAAIKLLAAQDAMLAAAEALERVGGDEAKLHASEMRGAIKVARRWELEMRRQHSMARTSWRGE